MLSPHPEIFRDSAGRVGQEWSTWATAAVKDPGVALWVVSDLVSYPMWSLV